MQPRITSVLAALITVSMVVFGQVCALGTLVNPSDPTAPVLRAEGQSAERAEHAGCTSEACGGESGENEGHCPSGAAMCCSTWAPPMSRLELPPPSLLRLVLTDFSPVLAKLTPVQDRAPGVALFELDRPPGSSSGLIPTSSLSHRGPPALS